MNAFINGGNYNHILSFDELDGFNFMYLGQNIQFQMVGTSDPAEIDIDTRIASPSNWALATLCGNQRNAMNALQGRVTLQGRIQFNTASSLPVGFRTLGINWDYRCNSIETHEFRIRTHGTDNPNLIARYDGPAAGHPYTFGTYGNSAVPSFKDDLLHIWSNPNSPIPPGDLIHVGIEQDVWDWNVVSAIALDAIGTPCTASLVSSHSWNSEFDEGAAPAPIPEALEGELNMGPPQQIRARGIMLRTSDSPVNRLSKLAIGDATGLKLTLRDLNRATLDQLARAGKLETIEQFQTRELKGNAEFVVVFQGKVEDLPPNVRSNGNYLILQRPQYVSRDLFVFVESANDEAVSGSFALIGAAPIGNIPGAQLPRLQIALLAGKKAQICWPDPSTGFVLQVTPDLTQARWSNVDAQVSIINRQKCVTLPVDKGNAFYRLWNPDAGRCFPLGAQQCLE